MLRGAPLSILFSALVWQASAGSDVIREVRGGRSFAGSTPPELDKGYLLFLAPSSPSLAVYDPKGRLVFDTTVQGPQGTPHLFDAAIDTNGTVVATGAYSGAPHGHGGALIFLDRSGKQTRFVPTDRYMPAHVCFASDHSIWTLGWQRDLVVNDTEDREDYFVFRKYSPDGKEAGAFVKRSSFPGKLAPGTAFLGPWGIRAANDRIGAVIGRPANRPEWIELDLSGKEIGSWKMGSWPTANAGLAFTSSGQLYEQTMKDAGEPGAGLLELAIFDRASSSWRVREAAVVRRADPHHGTLLGADGDNLVFEQDGGRRLFWKPAP